MSNYMDFYMEKRERTDFMFAFSSKWNVSQCQVPRRTITCSMSCAWALLAFTECCYSALLWATWMVQCCVFASFSWQSSPSLHLSTHLQPPSNPTPTPLPPPSLPPHPHLSDQHPFSLGALLSVVGQPWWKGSLRKNGYMYMYAWVPLLFAWNNHNFVNQLYSNIKLKRFFLLFFFFFKEKLFASCISRSKPSSMKDLPLQTLSGVWCHYNQRNPIYVL